jgi:hypothetical protein
MIMTRASRRERNSLTLAARDTHPAIKIVHYDLAQQNFRADSSPAARFSRQTISASDRSEVHEQAVLVAKYTVWLLIVNRGAGLIRKILWALRLSTANV